MQVILNYKIKLDDLLIFVIDKLPKEIKNPLLIFLEKNNLSIVNELRIHKSAYITLIFNQTNIKTDVYVSAELMDIIVSNLCEGSVYAHFDTIKNGYISLSNGIRAGICGKAVLENGEITGVRCISSINIRIPQRIEIKNNVLYDLLLENSFQASVLLYSAPGVGKTTILRDLITKLSQNTTVRHAVIDSREEITTLLDCSINSDVFLSYPKGLAIELATKSMTPQLIICDEISSIEEAEAIHNSVNCGVFLVATTHACSFAELKTKKSIRALLNGNVFDYALGVERNCQNTFTYTLDKLK